MKTCGGGGEERPPPPLNIAFTTLWSLQEEDRALFSLSHFGLLSLQTFSLHEAVTSRIHGHNSEAMCVSSVTPTAPGVSAQIRSFSLRQGGAGVPESAARGPTVSPKRRCMPARSTWLSLSRSPRGRDRTRAHAAARGSGRRRRSKGSRGRDVLLGKGRDRGTLAARARPGAGCLAAPPRDPGTGQRGAGGAVRLRGSKANRIRRDYSLSQDSRLSPSASAILQPPGPAQRPQTSREPERDRPGRGLHRGLRLPSAATEGRARLRRIMGERMFPLTLRFRLRSERLLRLRLIG